MRTLKEYFENSGRPQMWLADTLGVSRGYISDVVAGKKHPSPRLAAKIEAITGIPLRTLLGLDNEEDKR